MSETERTTCTVCGTRFPDGPRDTAAGGHFPPNGYLCDRCASDPAYARR